MRLSDLFAKVEDLSIVDVATNCCGLRLVQRGARYECLCPNPHHHDKHMGSFSIKPSGKYWGCFACDMGQHQGNASLVAELRGLTKVDAAIEIGLCFGLITQTEANQISSIDKTRGERGYRDILVRTSAPSDGQAKRKDADTLHLVYKSFVEAAVPMTREQKIALLTERHLERDDLKDFFLLPSKSQAFWVAFKKRLAKNGLTGTLNDILTGVPGFMRYKSNHRWSFVGRAGCLCLIYRDILGRIVGFQMRRSNDQGPKYIVFSSASVNTEVYDSYCSAGVLVDIIPPCGKMSTQIGITEGKFKGIALSKMGMWGVSIAGVGGWRHATKSLKDICGAIAPSRPTFNICYDADLKANQAVAKNAKGLAKMLQESFHSQVYFADWDLQYGKGIDDLMNAGFGHLLHYYPADQYLQKDFFLDAK